MEGTGLSHVLGLPELFHHSRHALLGLEGQPHRSAPRFGYDQDRRPAGHKKCLGAKSHTASVCTHWPLGPCYQAPGELAGEKLRPPPSSQPSLQGEVDLGAACSLRPPQPGAPFWRPSAGVSEVPGFSGGPSIFSRATLASAPTLWPAWPGGFCPSGACSPVPSPSPACLCSASSGQLGPKSQLPSVCLPPPPSPNAACPSWGARCLPAACLPACSMPKLSACRLLERTNLPTWPGPCPWSPAGPWRGWVTWLPSPEGHRSSLGSCPGCIGPTSAGQVGGSQSLLARGQPSLTLKQNRRGSQKPGSLTHSLPSSALPLCGGGGPEPLPG